MPEVHHSRKPKDEDFLETHDGLLCRVLGYLHPPDGYIAYPHYARDPGAEVASGVKGSYRKLPQRFNAQGIAGTIRYLEQHYPHYVVDDPVQGVRLPRVLRRCVRRYLCPEHRLAALLQRPRDPLEALVRTLTVTLADAAGVATSALGVTGSILAGLHDPETSDIDLVCYGREATRRLKSVLASHRLPDLDPVEDERLAHWVWELVHDFPVDDAAARYLVGRRWNCGRVGGRFFSIWAARADDEITEAYGTRWYRPLGFACVRAVVEDASDAVFLPAVYRVRLVAVTEGPHVPVDQVVSYDMRFVDAFDEGTPIDAGGQLEAVSDGTYRLVVGSEALAGRDYLRPAD